MSSGASVAGGRLGRGNHPREKAEYRERGEGGKERCEHVCACMYM